MATNMSIRRTRLNNLQDQHTMVKTSVVNEKWCTHVCAWTWDHFWNYFTFVEWIKQTRVFCKQMWHHLCRNRIFFQNGIHLCMYIHIQIQRKRRGKRHIQSTDGSYHWEGMKVQGGGGEWWATFSFYSSYLFFAAIKVIFPICNNFWALSSAMVAHPQEDHMHSYYSIQDSYYINMQSLQRKG